ncbi:MAG: ABC transporter substrate-binding protein, partial [Planctomycetes bacterium]|nr:ABC transporter substrate-binding protein [Planctomycetota bacterium]
AYRLIQHNLEQDRLEFVAEDTKKFLKNYPSSKYFDNVRRIQQNVSTRIDTHRGISREQQLNEQARLQFDPGSFPVSSATGQKIGIICPVSGKYARFGSSAIKGMELAVEDFKSESGQSLSFLVRDSKGHAFEVLKASQELIYTEGVIGIVGPILSESVISAGSVAQQAQVPLITPTATDREISLLGNYVFQLNNTLYELGKTIAEFAIQELGLMTFSVLHPQNSYGYDIVRGFNDVVIESGGEMLDILVYPADKTDFQEEIQTLKERPPAALFIPAEDNDILLITPQLNHYNFQVPLLGGNGWNSEKLLRLESKNIEGAYFTDSFYNGSLHPLYQQFKERYFQRYHEEPDKVAALTYDSTRLLLAGMQQGANDTGSLYRQLIELGMYQGVTGYVTITNDGRVNKHPQVFGIKNGQIYETFWVGSD